MLLRETLTCLLGWVVQVTADKYEALDKELLQLVEDVLLNKREDATERMLEYAATLDPKSRPTAVKKLGAEEEAAPQITPRLNPVSGEARIAAPDHMPPVPAYRHWVDSVQKSPQFEQVFPRQPVPQAWCPV